MFTLSPEADLSKKKVTVWNLNSGQVLGTPYEAAANRLVLSPDRTLLALPGPARLLDARTGRLLSPPLHESLAEGFTPDGRGLILLGRDRAVRIVEVEPEKSPAARPVPSAGPYSNFQFSEDGERLVSSGPQGLVVAATADGQVLRVWVQNFAYPAMLSDAHFTPDGATIVTRSASPLLGRVWDVSNGSPCRSNVPVGQLNPRAAYRPDGRAVLVVQDDAEHMAQLWDLDGQPAGTPFKVGGYVNWVEFHPDGSAVLIVGVRIEVWDPVAGRRIAAASEPPDVATAQVPTQPAPRPEARFVANGRLIDVIQAIVHPGGSATEARHQFRDCVPGATSVHRSPSPTFRTRRSTRTARPTPSSTPTRGGSGSSPSKPLRGPPG